MITKTTIFTKVDFFSINAEEVKRAFYVTRIEVRISVKNILPRTFCKECYYVITCVDAIKCEYHKTYNICDEHTE